MPLRKYDFINGLNNIIYTCYTRQQKDNISRCLNLLKTKYTIKETDL